MDKILVTGGSGLLGSNIAKTSAGEYTVHSNYRKNKVSLPGVEFFAADYTDKKSADKIKKINPDLIIHCAALVNLDYCEDHPDEAHNENVSAALNVARAAKECGAYLIHISTDAVFDGIKGDYRETDKTNPINVYGKTKLLAEKKILDLYPSACVARTNIYGWNKLEKTSLAEWIINKIKKKETVPGFKDVFFTPIFVNDLSELLFEVWRKKYGGVLHLTGGETISKYDFALEVADVFGLDKKLVVPKSVEEVNLRAPRGRNISLNVLKAEKLLGKKMPGIRDGLEEMKALYERGYVDELKDG